jgi:hypothetical protein
MPWTARMAGICVVACVLGVLEVECSCAMVRHCSGHGVCDPSVSICHCFEGWGADTDVATYKTPDCSARGCFTCTERVVPL